MKTISSLIGSVSLAAAILSGILFAAENKAADSSAASAFSAKKFYFYDPDAPGSQAQYQPFNVIINGGFGVWQIATVRKDRGLFRYPYGESWNALYQDINSPVTTLKQYGVKRFLFSEIVPFSFDPTSQQFFPNYFLHGIGAGMHSRKAEEWFSSKGFPLPRLWSAADMVAYHILSEMIEFGSNPHLSVDPIADLYVFDPLGFLLFTNDRVCNFFSNKLQFNEWSLQPAYNFSNGYLENMGQFYVLKYPVTKDKKWSLFGRAGLHELAGFTRTFSQGRSLSLGFGAGVENIVKVNDSGPGLKQTAEWIWSTGAFYDINNSLMASLTVTGMPQDRIRLNIYPDLLKWGKCSPSLQFAWGDYIWAGIGLPYFPLSAAGTIGD